MNEKGGSQSSENTAPATGRPATSMDVIRRPVEPPAQRTEVAPPPPEVMEQIAPKDPPAEDKEAESEAKPVAAPTPMPIKEPAPEAASDEPAQSEKPIDPRAAEKAAKDSENPEALLEDIKKANAKEQGPPPGPIKPKKHGSGVVGAIIATVIIVLGLAGLTVYAYLQSQTQ